MKPRETGRNRANLGISAKTLKNFRLPSGQTIIQSSKKSPLWELVNKELPRLLADLEGDPKHQQQVKRIGILLADSDFPRIGEVLFVNLTEIPE
jgi:hypothetical protein